MFQSNARVRFSLAGIGMVGGSELHRDFHSTPDLAAAVNGSLGGPRQHRSQEELRLLPPPTHPPPPPPNTTVVKVDVKDGVEYGNITTADPANGKHLSVIFYYCCEGLVSFAI